MSRALRHPRASRQDPGRRGQSLVEFALVLPLFLLLVFSVIDGGRYVFVSSAVSNAAREAARLGSVEASWLASTDPSCGAAGGPVCPVDFATLRTHITTAANRQMAPFGTVTNLYIDCVGSSGSPPTGGWTTSTCSARASGGYLSVRVTYTWRAITPVIGNIMGPITTSASATVTIN
jgi:Flp pilus assembly protein TadG